MDYYRCVTCDTIIADKYELYEKGAEKIREDPKLTDEQKDKLVGDLPRVLKLKRYCCMPRLMLYINGLKILN